MSFWPTYHLNNPIGAVFAWIASRLACSPNAVSVASLGATLGGPIILLIFPGKSQVMQAVVLFVFFQLGYTLDGADGMLARVTRRGTPFGQIFDKLIDAVETLSIPFLLYLCDRGGQETISSDRFGVYVCFFLPCFQEPYWPYIFG